MAAWLESVPGAEAATSLASAEQSEAELTPAVDDGTQKSCSTSLPDSVPAPPPEPRAETPELHGFVDVGSGTPIRAALFYRGETTLVAVGDRVGDYTVITLEPSEAVVLSRGEGTAPSARASLTTRPLVEPGLPGSR